MNVHQFSDHLAAAGDRQLRLQLPFGQCVPAHFHVTEVGKNTKDFVDCGGVRRVEQSCVLQTLVAEDVEHRLRADKLQRILELTRQLDLAAELPIEFEIQGQTVEVCLLENSHLDDFHLTLGLAAKQTACPAPDKCGIGGNALPTVGNACCGNSGCC